MFPDAAGGSGSVAEMLTCTESACHPFRAEARFGVAVMVTLGFCVSRSTGKFPLTDTFPARSLAETWKVVSPSALIGAEMTWPTGGSFTVVLVIGLAPVAEYVTVSTPDPCPVPGSVGTISTSNGCLLNQPSPLMAGRFGPVGKLMAGLGA